MNRVFSNTQYSVCKILFLLTFLALRASAADLRLSQAVERGDKVAVQALLKQKVDVNARRLDGSTALAWAAYVDDAELATLLLNAGANPNLANDAGATPLWIACSNVSVTMMDLLLKAGADANLALNSGETCLMTIAGRGNLDAARLLLRHNASVNAQENRAGQNALMWAAAEKQAEMVKLLLDAHANPKTKSKSGFTPLLFAARSGDLQSAQYLLEAGASVKEATEKGVTALMMAVVGGHQELAIMLLDRGTEPNIVVEGYTPLHYAASSRNALKLVGALLDHGANVNARVLHDNSQAESKNATFFLVGAGQPVGATPFYVAAVMHNVDIMRLLVERSADTAAGTTATVNLNEVAGIKVESVAGTTPLMAAAGAGLARANYPEYSEAEEARALDALKYLLSLGADINAANEWGQTALHAAAYIGADKLIRFLVENGARIDAKDGFGQTPLSIAGAVVTPAITRSFDAKPRFVRPATTKLLLELGATPLAASGVQVATGQPEGSVN